MAGLFKKIIWATDFSDEATEALLYAEQIAKIFKAELTALHVVPDFSPALYNAVAAIKGELVKRVDFIKTDAEKKLKDLIKERDLSCNILIKEGPTARKIIEALEEEKADLVVMGKRGTSSLEKLFIGSTANQVLRESPVPILLTRKGSIQQKIDKILVPTDFSEHEEEERDIAWKLAKKLDADLLLLYVLELHDYEFPPRVLDQMFDSVMKKLKARKKKEHEDIRVSEKIHRAINAAIGIVDFADTHKCDLIVISTCGSGRLERFFLGSTTEKVISHSSIPVFAIPRTYCAE